MFVGERESEDEPMFALSPPCHGDDSAICCDIVASGQLVIVAGMLEADERHPRGYGILHPEICEVAR
jgi:hypothetical protein